MIRTINEQIVSNIATTMRHPYYLLAVTQIITVLLLVSFVVVQQIYTSEIVLDFFFLTLWCGGEVVGSVMLHRVMKMRREDNTKIGSKQNKQNAISLRMRLISWKYIKFVSLICNLLGLLGELRDLREREQLSIAILWPTLSLPLAVFSLKIVTTLINLYSKILSVFNNFQMDFSDQKQTQPQLRLLGQNSQQDMEQAISR